MREAFLARGRRSTSPVGIADERDLTGWLWPGLIESEAWPPYPTIGDRLARLTPRGLRVMLIRAVGFLPSRPDRLRLQTVQAARINACRGRRRVARGCGLPRDELLALYRRPSWVSWGSHRPGVAPPPISYGQSLRARRRTPPA